MHLRKLVLGCGFACALISNVVSALGLGEVRLNSTLNEPLNAEIKLLDTRGLNDNQILVDLASPADFERNGVDRLYFLTEFQFEVLLEHPGGAVVRVTSRSPVREPFINFLVEARWPTGRLLREYTLLMDLPTFSDTRASTPVQSATTRAAPPSSADTSTPQASRQVSTPARSAPARAANSSFTGDSYTVTSNDTLWQIALDVRPDSSHSVHQTMLAIQRLNPDAFINGNINLLRKGQVLRVPSSDDIQSLSRRDAVNEVARQNQSWSDDNMGAQLSASQRDRGSRRNSDTLSGSVSLATPSRNDSSSGQGSGDNSGRGRALETELSSTLEELDKARSENSELSSRVRDLEDQIQTMERLVDVSNEQLRALQLSATQNEDATSTDTASSLSSSDYEASPASDSDVSDDTVAENASEPAAEVPVVKETPKPEVKRVIVPPQPSKTIMDHIMDHIVWIGGGVLVLVGLVGFLFYRRMLAAEHEAFENNDIFDMELDAPYQEEVFEEEDIPEDLEDDSVDHLLEEEDIPAESETGDVVGEADIYIAYGKFDQAEEMLLTGLAKDQSSVDIRLKLLEVYSQTQDVAKFDHYYAGLMGVAGQSALARAAELREHIAGAADFDPAGADDGETHRSGIDLAAGDDLELDLNVESNELLEDADDLTLEDDLDFSLDLDDGSDSSLSLEDTSLLSDEDLSEADNSKYDLSFGEESAAEATTDDEFSFDFDLEESDPEQAVSADDEIVSLEEDDGLSFELDDVDTGLSSVTQDSLVEELEVEDDELSFDFDDTELDVTTALEEPAAEETESGAELQLSDDADDFNLDMDMGDLDLAALDEEMEGLDADFAIEEDNLGELNTADDLELLDADIVEEDSVAFGELEEALASQPAASTPAVEAEAASEEDVFDQALSEFVVDDSDESLEEIADFGELSDDDMDSELDFLADADEAATKLDLARAYIDMGDTDGARDILAEVAHEGNDEQRQEAVDLLSRIDT